MRKALRVALLVGMIAATLSPAHADPASQRDIAGLVTGAPQRYVPQEIGKPVDLHYLFGPYVVPPGQDSNRITVDVPIQTGYIIAVAPDLVDATNGRIPTQQEAHIHHAHWFRVTNDPEQDYYPGLSYGGMGASWVFGTGEEKTQGRLDERAKLDPANNDTNPNNDFNYGIFVDGNTPQVLIYMIHNKTPSVGHYFVVLDVSFIPGTRDEIKTATGGKDIHTLYGQLWGQTKDVTDASRNIGARMTASHDGVAVAMGSHLHPGGKAVVVSNLGPDIDPGSGVHPLCQGIDPDGDGYDGVALLDSYKYDKDMDVWPYSEQYQMGATKYGWRAPIHKGDILEQKATYAVVPGSSSSPFNLLSRDILSHNWYQAMSYTGIYVDRDQSPGPAPTACTMDAFAPTLYGADRFDTQNFSKSWVPAVGESQAQFDARVDAVRQAFNLFLPAGANGHQHTVQGMVNHLWNASEALCAQSGLSLEDKLPSCGDPDVATTSGPAVTQIHVAGFTYVPGDLSNYKSGLPLVIPTVKEGTQLQLVNEDFALNVRHTFTSCQWPCVGTYVSNFPLPSGGQGSFDTGKLGNIDPIDGGLFNDGGDIASFAGGGQSDTVPTWHLDIDAAHGFVAGQRYAYFCRIHPFMRGAFEVVA
jgi:hypothetical protein